MNLEHVDKVKRVCLKSEAARAKLGSGPSLTSTCERFWAEEFPADYLEHNKPLDLGSADLQGLVLVAGEPLIGANLRRANLDRTTWIRTRIEGADLTAASLRGSRVDAMCDRTSFREADLSGATISLFGFGAKFVDMSSANLSEAVFVVSFVTPRINFTGATMRGCHVVFGELQAGNQTIKTTAGQAEFLNSLSEEQSSQIVLGPKQAESEQVTPSKSSGSGCFIATAACGSDQADDVVHLRLFRDTILVRAKTGRSFIAAYELFSPPLARLIAGSPDAAKFVRGFVVRPASRLADWLLQRNGTATDRHRE